MFSLSCPGQWSLGQQERKSLDVEDFIKPCPKWGYSLPPKANGQKDPSLLSSHSHLNTNSNQTLAQKAQTKYRYHL